MWKSKYRIIYMYKRSIQGSKRCLRVGDTKIQFVNVNECYFLIKVKLRTEVTCGLDDILSFQSCVLSGLQSNRLYTAYYSRQHRHSQNISKTYLSHIPHGISAYSLAYFFVTPSSSLDVDGFVVVFSSSFFSSVFSLFNSNERNTPVPLTSSVLPIPYAIVSIAVFIDQ